MRRVSRLMWRGALGLLSWVGVGLLPVQAADFLPSGLMSSGPASPGFEAEAPEEFSDWYLRGDMGAGNPAPLRPRFMLTPGFSAPGYQFEASDMASTMVFGGGLGYRFNRWFRMDLTADYRLRMAYRAITSYLNYNPPGGICGTVAANPRCLDLYNGSVGQFLVLMNGYIDLGTWFHLTPFLGAGVGWAHTSIGSITDVGVGNGGAGFSQGRSTDRFAWALIGGVSYTINSRLKVEVSYRYADAGRATSGEIVCQNTSGCGFERHSWHMASHDVRFGLRWTFGDTPPAAPTAASSAQMPITQRF